MIQAIEITNHKDEHVRLELSNPWEVGLAVIYVDGLGPVETNVHTTEYGSAIDGALFNSARATSRNIVMSLVFLDTLKSIEEIRHDTYKFFPIKEKLKFLVETDIRVIETYGWVESNNPSIFDRQEGCQISIICTNPWFYDSLKDASITLKSILDGFKFPFCNNIHPINEFQFYFANNSLTEDHLQFYDSSIENYISFGEIGYFKEQTLRYLGEITTGVTIQLIAHGDVRNPIIKNGRTGEYMKLNTAMLEALTGNGFISGDEIIIETTKGSKSVTLIRDGDKYNILNCLNPKTDWISVIQGDNQFSYTSDQGDDNLEIRITAKFAYAGA